MSGRGGTYGGRDEGESCARDKDSRPDIFVHPPTMSLLFSSLRAAPRIHTASVSSPLFSFTRNRSQLAPRRVRYRKSHKGRVPVPIGGSTKGTTLKFGEYGLRVRGEGMRLTAKQLQAAEVVIKRKLKIIKTSQVWMRVFPDLPVCVKVSWSRYG